MIISLNWLKKFTDIDVSVDELATLIGARLVEIEEIIDLGTKYKGAIVAKVVDAQKLEGSDHLSITKIDDGGVTADVERDESGLVQVVCGAPNIKTDQMVVWLPPGSIVPETYSESEPFVLGSRKLCGTMSNGMIASSRELALSDEHEGILELDTDIVPGTSFAKAYELDDYLLDIENKSLTHRPDCFGIIGFAREVAAIQGKTFKTPDWLMDLSLRINSQPNNEIALNVSIDDVELSNRYQAIVMSNADSNKQSPLQVQTYLSRVGIRPINAVVDVTNFLMMLTGQPLHAFDYDKVVAVAGGKADIHVRSGNKGEKLELLDGRTIELTTEDIVIAAGETVIGLAGAMGGANTEIDENTKNIIIESATFNLYRLRSTQMRHGISSEAITRFTKGQPADLTAPVLSAAIKLMSKWSGAECVSEIIESYPGKKDDILLAFMDELINNVLGSDFTREHIVDTLNRVGFTIDQSDGETLKLTVPYWRADIHLVEDIVEEVGRLNGFDNINPTLPKRDFVAVQPSEFDSFRKKLRKTLVKAGANEVLTYSFIHSDVINKAGQDVNNSYRVINSISPSLQYYRQTLTPSLLGLIHPNIKQGYDNLALFEINKSHKKQDGMNDENVPIESEMAAMVVSDKGLQLGAAYYKAKRMFDYLCKMLGLSLVYKPIEADLNEPLNAPFEYRRSAWVVDSVTGVRIGIVGEYKKSVVKKFKLPEYTAGFEFDTTRMFELYRNLGNRYKSISRYPGSDRDICFQVADDISFGKIINVVTDVLRDIELETNISPVDIYQPESCQTKNITIRIKLTSHDKTLTGEAITEVIDNVIASVIEKTSAKIV